MADYEVYESLPPADKWMAHATMNVTNFLEHYNRKFLHMIWMVVYDPRGAQGTAQWYITAETRQDEIDLLSSDEEYEQEQDVSMDTDRSEADSEDGGNTEEDDPSLSGGELDDLMGDAYGEDAAQQAEAFQKAANEDVGEDSNDKPTLIPPLDHTTKHSLRLSNLNPKPRVSHTCEVLFLKSHEDG